MALSCARKVSTTLWSVASIFCLLATIANLPTKCNAQDSSKVPEILLKLFEETGGLNWKERENWNGNPNRYCNWYGIECYDVDDSSNELWGQIESIDLSDNKLVGTIPRDIWKIPYLKSLVVRENPALDVDFQDIEDADNLQFLILSNTAITSFRGLHGAHYLRELHLTSCGLSGPIPSQVFSLHKLEGLFANYNSFTGNLPPEIGQLTDLRDLYLRKNSLTGSIPEDIGLLTRLRTLALSDNFLSGNLPIEALNNLAELQILALNRDIERVNDGGFTGPLPDFSNLEEITQIYLQDNSLTGSIPGDFLLKAPKDVYVTVDIRNNQLSGEIKANRLDEFERMKLFAAGNKFTSIDSKLCDNSNWMDGDISECNEILCEKGTWAPLGFKTYYNDCVPCVTNDFMGMKDCAENRQVDILLEFYNAMGGDNWEVSDWDIDEYVCDWFGITCDVGGEVTEIRLHNNKLSGYVGPRTFLLPALQVLDLSENFIDFRFDGIKEAKNLRSLIIYSTGLYTLKDIEQLKETSISELIMSSNTLLDEIPDAVYELTNLEYLSFSHNSMSGKISPNVKNLSKLQVFRAYGNRLIGTIPSEFGQLKELTDLVVSENDLTGTIPNELSDMPKLEEISIHQWSNTKGGLSGPLPDFANCPNLARLHLSSNSLNGPLPADLLKGSTIESDLVEISLGGNKFTGDIPSEWGERFNLLYLDLSDNQIDSVPSELCNKDQWQNGIVGCDAILCDKGYYSITGKKTKSASCDPCMTSNYMGATECDDSEQNEALPILKALYTSTNGNSWNVTSGWLTDPNVCQWYGIFCEGANIVKIKLDANNLSGVPTTDLFKILTLRELDLKDNDIDFDFTNIGLATSLEMLYLSSTQLSSIEGIGGAKTLKILHVTDNYLSGEIPDELYELTNLESLFMNYNRFSGRLSTKIEKLENLKELYLISNQLSGQIPHSIGKLEKLKILALAQNNFGGTIPEEFNDLTNIEVLSVQREMGDGRGSGLTGHIPSFNKLSKLHRLYLGHNALTGTIPYDFLNGVSDKKRFMEVELMSNELQGLVPSSLNQFDQLNIYLADNDFSDIAPGLCNMKKWMDGKVESYDCDALMCKPGFFSTSGRTKDDEVVCAPCPESSDSEYWGSFSCLEAHEVLKGDEKEILKVIYNELDGRNWNRQDNWLEEQVDICEWYGITCTSGEMKSIESIRLPSNALNGIVPGILFDLKELSEVDLSGNEVTFKFDSIEKADKLEYLNLDSTGLKSLDGIENAANLKLLHVVDNDFDEFPSNVLSLSGLEILYLSFNSFDIEIPSELQSLKDSLVYFQCNMCGFKNSIPTWFGEFDKLQYLSLGGNRLTGEIPIEISKISSLKHLRLSNQVERGGGLNGAVPSFDESLSISQLYLDQNNLSGPIPDAFLKDTQADSIIVDLRNNMLDGDIPEELFDHQFEDFTLLLADNKMDISDTICGGSSDSDWNRGDLVQYGCDGLLCAPGYYSPMGRSTDGATCDECLEDGYAEHFGSTVCGDNKEKDILEILYSTLGGPDWDRNFNWLDAEDVCDWYGIECDYYGVTGINLEDNGLVGDVPAILFNMTSLVEINLKKNDVNFSFEGIGQLTELQVLKLSETGLSSVDGISAVKDSLTTLHLTSNYLTSFPEELYELVNLEQLFMNYNDINSELSPKIGDMVALKGLYLFRNNIKGSIPEEMSNLANLEILSMGENDFTGSIPSGFNSLPNLEILALQKIKSESDKVLTGNIPPFNKTPKLREVYLGYNKLLGTIPANFLAAVDDESAGSVTIRLDFTENRVQGSLPTSLKRFSNLNIYLSGNEIESLDDSFCSLSGWMDGGVGEIGCNAILCPTGTYSDFGRQTTDGVGCEACPFTYEALYLGSTICTADMTDYNEREILAMIYEATDGTNWEEASNWKEDDVSICDWHGVHCASEDSSSASNVVKQLHLPSNKLSGTIPPQIFGLKHLEMLNLRDNNVDFEFHGIGEALMLKDLYLDSTNVRDIDGIGEAKNLKTLHLQQNDFSGFDLPEELFELTNLKHLFISDCQFIGTIPSNIGQLTKLEDFYSHGNDITGTIPSEIGLLESLEVLVISENKFVGPIPEEIMNLKNLHSLYINSFTRRNAGLSGPIPSFSGMSKLREIYLGANSLTGTIPSDFLAGVTAIDERVTVNLQSNRIEGGIPASLAFLNKLNIDLSDNFITKIDDDLCLKEDWNKGGVEYFECHAILCPAGTFNQFGYQLSASSPCKKCEGSDESNYLGATLCQSEVKNREREILESFYKLCGGENWKNKENWLDPEVDICHWYGISCRSGGTVDSILLGSNNLVGTPPREIFQLTSLKWLWLYSNPMKFSFHGIDQAQQLTSLLLDSTGLESVDGISGAYQVTDLDLRFNRLSGPFPSEISNLANLEILSITDNDLTGTVPSLRRLHRLQSLRISENKFSGPLPDFATHTKLKTLDFSGNLITGEIPENFLSSVRVEEKMFIDLSANRLEGSLPSELSRFPEMTIFARDNLITGIDGELCGNDAWNDGDIGSFNCNGLLCPPGTFAEGRGRETNSGGKCVECDEAKFYGQSQCIDLRSAYYGNPANMRKVNWALLSIFAIGIIVWTM